ncbi:MAG: hypothetical protein U9O98_00265, partial [Asgard group archaeon]|nr:hypothetical protein [Asgard group archaeon]
MKLKHFFIGFGLIVGFGLLFCFHEYTLPAIVFAGIIGGIYMGVKRKRPFISCLYDGLIVSLPAGVILGFLLIPVLWFLHGYRYI